jgi:hypothetical protein
MPQQLVTMNLLGVRPGGSEGAIALEGPPQVGRLFDAQGIEIIRGW